jgi:hypothetical protein
MSRTKQLPGARSYSVVQSGTAASVIRIDRQNNKLRKFIPTMVVRLALQALGRFVCDVACIIADCLIAALSWLLSEFVAGCAVYAETMHPIAAAMDDRDASLNHAASEAVRPAPAATRLRLVVVGGSAQEDLRLNDQLPSRQAATPARLTPRDWTVSQDEQPIRSARVPAARRNNRPR